MIFMTYPPLLLLWNIKTMFDEALLNALLFLKAEDPRYQNLLLPESLDGRLRLMRALLNVREAKPVSDKFLAWQNEVLQEVLKRKGIVTLAEIAPCKSDPRLRIYHGDITRLQVDAIVNAANSSLLGCFIPLHNCIDNVIHSQAGVEMRFALAKIMQKQGSPEMVGKAKITLGYNLPARFVLHTVGPDVSLAKPTTLDAQDLASCYRSCLKLAQEHHLKSVAFCCISTGVFGYPQQEAACIAVSTVKDYLKKTSSINSVIFNVFKDADLKLYKELLGK